MTAEEENHTLIALISEATRIARDQNFVWVGFIVSTSETCDPIQGALIKCMGLAPRGKRIGRKRKPSREPEGYRLHLFKSVLFGFSRTTNPRS